MEDEVTKTYAEALYPGSLLPEEYIEEVTVRDAKAVAKKHPRAFQIQFYDLTSKTVKVDGLERSVAGKRKNVSPKYFPKAKTFTLKQVRAMGSEHSILAWNMESNGWKKVVQCCAGNWQPFDDDKDCLLSVKRFREAERGILWHLKARGRHV